MKITTIAIVAALGLAACAEFRFSPVGYGGITRAQALPSCDAQAARQWPIKPSFLSFGDYDARLQRILSARRCMEAKGFLSR